MLLTCGWISEIMEGHAPTTLALEYDNVGLILGSQEQPLRRVLVALDLTDAVAEEAIAAQVDLVLTHHPMIFRAIKKITGETAQGRRIMRLLRHNIAVYAAHTNLDIAAGGTNDVLADLLGLTARAPLMPTEPGAGGESAGLGRVGELPQPRTLGELAQELKEKCALPVVGVVGEPQRPVRRVGLCTGAGADAKYIALAQARDCDVYITGDVTYHNAQAAEEAGIALIDATHYGTEVIVVKALRQLLEARAEACGAALEVLESEVDARTIRYV